MSPLNDLVKSVIAIAKSNIDESKKESEIMILLQPVWDDSLTLDKLHAGGVDNWEGYDDAMWGDDE